MASDTKTPTTRRKTSTETVSPKAPTKVTKAASKAVKVTKETPKAVPAKTKKAATSKPDKPAEKAKAPKKPKTATPITAEARLRHIEVAAYYIAEQRGFSAGDTAADWLLAEQQVDRLLLAGKLVG